MLTIAQDQELDLGANRIAPGMQRHCALTRTLKPVDDMIRFVVGPGGHTVPDVKRKLPGRGIWVTGTRAAIDRAIKEKVFPRAFKQNVRVSADLAATTETMLTQSALDALAIAGKASQVVAGFAKVEAALADGDVLALIHAAEAASDGRRKLDAAAQRELAEKSRQIAIIESFTGEQLDLALNRPNVVHAALLAGPVSDTFVARAKRLERFRSGTSPELTSTQAPIEGA
jgi:predicted RNA-binding protein YlxR (DUF448 family)